MDQYIIKNFLDEFDRIKVWPTKRNKQKAISEYLGSKFEDNKIYSCMEIDTIIKKHIDFDEVISVRRELIDWKILNRTKDGRKYWVVDS